MNQLEAGTAWWRPEAPALAAAATGEETAPSRLAFWSLVAFTAILLLTPQYYLPALKVLRIALLSGGLAIGAYILEATARRRTVMASSPEVATVMVMLLWSVFTIPFSYWPGGSVQLLTDQYIEAIVFFWLIATLVTTQERLRLFGWSLVLCAIPLAVIAIVHFKSGLYITSADNAVQRIGGIAGLTGNPNDLALALNLFIPVAGVLFVVARTWVGKAIAGLSIFLSVPAVIVTFSRAGFLTLLAIAFMFLVFCAKRRSFAPVIIAAVILGCAVPLLPAGYLDRLNTITDIDADQTGSAQGRWTDLQLATQVVAANPVIGVGLGQDILALDQLRAKPTWRSVHNAFLECAVDLGLPGLALFLGLILVSFRSARRIERSTSRDPSLLDLTMFAEGMQISIVAFIVGAFFAPIAYQFFFFCVAGLAVALKNSWRTVATERAAA